MTDSRIYTKLGDDGSTGMLFGGRVSKGDVLIDAVGCVDEAVATLGLARASGLEPALAEIVLGVQRDLFVVGADLIAQPRARDRLVAGVSLVTPDMVAHLEEEIDRLVAERPLRPVFVVPGATTASAALDVARAQVRTAERRLVALRAGAGTGDHGAGAETQHRGAAADAEHRTEHAVNAQVALYLNRVSDLIFVLARHAAGETDEPASHEPRPRDE